METRLQISHDLGKSLLFSDRLTLGLVQRQLLTLRLLGQGLNLRLGVARGRLRRRGGDRTFRRVLFFPSPLLLGLGDAARQVAHRGLKRRLALPPLILGGVAGREKGERGRGVRREKETGGGGEIERSRSQFDR